MNPEIRYEFGELIDTAKIILTRGREKFVNLGVGLLLFGNTAVIWENPQNSGPDNCPRNSILTIGGRCTEVIADPDLNYPSLENIDSSYYESLSTDLPTSVLIRQ